MHLHLHLWKFAQPDTRTAPCDETCCQSISNNTRVDALPTPKPTVAGPVDVTGKENQGTLKVCWLVSAHARPPQHTNCMTVRVAATQFTHAIQIPRTSLPDSAVLSARGHTKIWVGPPQQPKPVALTQAHTSTNQP